MTVWAGVDVGGRRKGFHAAIIDTVRVVAGPLRLRTVDEASAWLRTHEPSLVAVDSPRTAAPDGLRSRPEERALVRTVCGLRYTPDAARLAGNPYYEWIRHGFELYSALEAWGLDAIECFPTASWTRWAGPRGSRPRGSWSALALAGTGLRAVPRGLDQDGRDAIGAALTARCRGRGRWESFGPIVVPA